MMKRKVDSTPEAATRSPKRGRQHSQKSHSPTPSGLLLSRACASLEDPEKQIRLLKLLPGTRNDAIHLELGIFYREEAPEYLAISYVWGDDLDDQDVYVGGVTHRVRKNCAYALWQARLHYSGEWIWMDSICINQDDPKEKGHQVKMMGDIYASAKLTLLCVGPGREDVDAITAVVPDLEQLDLETLHPKSHEQNVRLSGTEASLIQQVYPPCRSILQRSPSICPAPVLEKALDLARNCTVSREVCPLR